jgi:hypothetical protein
MNQPQAEKISMNNRDVNALTPERSCLLNIYDRFAALGRAMQRSSAASTNSQAQHSLVTSTQIDETTGRGESRSMIEK